jgi:hypothetical protein
VPPIGSGGERVQAYNFRMTLCKGDNLAVPKAIRRQMQQWGYCKNEFERTGGWTPTLYVREARRMNGATS